MTLDEFLAGDKLWFDLNPVDQTMMWQEAIGRLLSFQDREPLVQEVIAAANAYKAFPFHAPESQRLIVAAHKLAEKETP